jgi:hypothetical protein
VKKRQRTDKLVAALGTIDEPIGVYDSNDRLVAFNRRYATVRSSIGGKVVLGSQWTSLVFASVAAGTIPEAVGREDEWLRYRIAMRGDYSVLRWVPGGLGYLVNEQRTRDGGVAVVWSNVTRIVARPPSRLLPEAPSPEQGADVPRASAAEIRGLFMFWRFRGHSVRACSVLSLARCRSVADIRALGPAFFRAQPNCGATTLLEIERLADGW